MYKALKLAQNEIQEALLKFADEVSSLDKKVQSSCPRGDPCQCALVTQSMSSPAPVAHNPHFYEWQRNQNGGVASPVASPAPVENERFEIIERTLQYMIQKHDSQYAVLIDGIQELNMSLKNIVKVLVSQAEKEQVVTSSIIPNIQPVSHDSDLKTVCIQVESDIEPSLSHESDQVSVDAEAEVEQEDELNTAVDLDSVADEAEAEVEAEEEVEAEAEAEEEEEQEEEVEVEQELEEEGVEVEEWTYKSRVFFKDSENTVYANNSGEIGDPIGQYDPVKNIVRPLKK